MAENLVAIVLAAGRGTRMRSPLSKVLHPVLGRPMAAWPVGAAFDAGASSVIAVVGHQADAVSSALREAFPDAGLRFARQDDPQGTGHAVQQAVPMLGDSDAVLILCGDTPALDGPTLTGLIEAHKADGAALTVVAFTLENPTGYGRVQVDSEGRPVRIVEEKDANTEERRIRSVNAGVYIVARDVLESALGQLTDDNAQGEYYLTDIVALASRAGARTYLYILSDAGAVSGVNTRAQLGAIEEVLRQRRLEALMLSGVTVDAPLSARVEWGVSVQPGAHLGPGVVLRGATSVAEGAWIESGCVVTDCDLGIDVHLKPYVVAEGARLGEGATAGPFAHLRPGTVLGKAVKVGNFVETKKAVFGDGSKASHLSYLGDCELGKDVNIGAGTITCNYDGFSKHRTEIGDNVFVGSDTQLVAPVTIGKNATIGAGTTVTRDVPEGALTVSRTRQVDREGYYLQRRKGREDARDAKNAAAALGAQKEQS